MALVKKCAHGKGLSARARQAAWRRCGCAWVTEVRRNGKRVYLNLGRDETAARVAVERIEQGIDPHRASGTGFSVLADRWVAMKATQVRHGTIHGYRCSLPHAKRWFGDADVSLVTAADLEEFEAAMITAGYAPLYARNARGVAQMVLGHAVRAGLIQGVPRLQRRRSQRTTVKPRQHLTPAELARVWAHARRSLDLFQIGAMTGMRAGELLALHADDIDERNRVITVRHNLDRFGRVAEVKSAAGRRDIDIPAEALAILPTRAGRLWPLHYSTALDHWHEAVAGAGIERCGLHTLRHSNAAMRLALGQDLPYIAAQLGHASPEVTLREYGHLMDRERRDAGALAVMLHGDAAPAEAAAVAPRQVRRPARRRAADG